MNKIKKRRRKSRIMTFLETHLNKIKSLQTNKTLTFSKLRKRNSIMNSIKMTLATTVMMMILTMLV